MVYMYNNYVIFLFYPLKKRNEIMTEQIAQSEGLCLMQYECKVCKKKERIWNSRPRVTPFMISCSTEACEGPMVHIAWKNDIYAPNYKPQIGERIFVDLAEEAAEKFWIEEIKKIWGKSDGDFAIKDIVKTKEQALEFFMKDWHFGQPHIITIEKEIE